MWDKCFLEWEISLSVKPLKIALNGNVDLEGETEKNSKLDAVECTNMHSIFQQEGSLFQVPVRIYGEWNLSLCLKN